MNEHEAHYKINEAYNEFLIGKSLDHENIIKYNYFIHDYSEEHK